MKWKGPLGDEHGAVIVQAAIAMLVLVGFTAFVVDYGVLWVSREQAQHAADAGALSGALGRAYDDPTDPPPGGGGVEQSASRMVAANPVWFAPPVAVVSFSCPPGVAGGRCVRVDVHRDGTFGSSPIPIFFGGALGLTSQGVRATATAQVAAGNSTTCLKPWAMPDKWVELNPVPASWTAASVFEAYLESGPGAGSPTVPADSYVPPDAVGPGTGLSPGGEIGLSMALSFADPEGNPLISPGFLLPLLLAGGGSYEDNITACNGRLSAIGQYVPTGTAAMLADTTDGFADLIAADPGAVWNTTNESIDSSCAPVCAPISPRLVAIALFDVERYQFMRANNDWSACPGGNRCVLIVNIVGFFLDTPVGPGQVSGYLGLHPGLASPDNPSVSQVSSFIPAITLVR